MKPICMEKGKLVILACYIAIIVTIDFSSLKIAECEISVLRMLFVFCNFRNER